MAGDRKDTPDPRRDGAGGGRVGRTGTAGPGDLHPKRQPHRAAAGRDHQPKGPVEGVPRQRAALGVPGCGPPDHRRLFPAAAQGAGKRRGADHLSGARQGARRPHGDKRGGQAGRIHRRRAAPAPAGQLEADHDGAHRRMENRDPAHHTGKICGPYHRAKEKRHPLHLHRLQGKLSGAVGLVFGRRYGHLPPVRRRGESSKNQKKQAELHGQKIFHPAFPSTSGYRCGRRVRDRVLHT